MGVGSVASGFQAIGQAVRRLHDTEASFSSVPDALGLWLGHIAASAATLLNKLTPRFLFEEYARLWIAVSNTDQARLAVHRNGAVIGEHSIDLDRLSILSLQQALPESNGVTSAVVSVSDGAALSKRLSISASVSGRKLPKALDYMLEVESPFRREQILWNYRTLPGSRHGEKTVELVIVPRTIIDPIIDRMNSCGIHVRELQYQASLAPDDVIRIADYPTRADSRRRRFCLALGILLCLETVAIAALPFVSNAAWSDRLATRTRQLTQTASEFTGIRAEFETALKPLAMATADLQALPSPAAILQILQRELGPDVVLDRLSLRGRSIQLSGSAANLTSVVDRLERSQHFKPKSVAANGKAGDQQYERFTLSLELTERQ